MSVPEASSTLFSCLPNTLSFGFQLEHGSHPHVTIPSPFPSASPHTLPSPNHLLCLKPSLHNSSPTDSRRVLDFGKQQPNLLSVSPDYHCLSTLVPFELLLLTAFFGALNTLKGKREKGNGN